MSERSVHIASEVVTINERWMRQVCSWCGIKLLDYDLERMMMPTGQEGDPPATWPEGTIVVIEGHTKYFVANTERLPDDCCAVIETKRLAAGPSEAEAMDAEGQTIAANFREGSDGRG